MTPKQRARRWRAACPLNDNDGVPDGWELEWNFDSDNDGVNSWHTCRLENGSIDINITYKNRTNARKNYRRVGVLQAWEGWGIQLDVEI